MKVNVETPPVPERRAQRDDEGPQHNPTHEDDAETPPVPERRAQRDDERPQHNPTHDAYAETPPVPERRAQRDDEGPRNDPTHGSMSDANLDFGRFARRGYAEAVFCLGKTTEQVGAIAALWREKAESTDTPLGTVLFTRATPEQLDAIADELGDVVIDELARLAAWPAEPPEPTGGHVVVVCAGTSDLPVAREAALTARHLGRSVTEVVDVGVAGLNRVLARVDTLRAADVIVVVAGMDAALVPVVAGLVGCPIVAVPTSVGYGAAFDGVSALLSMLNACAPGVGVVNIDNGYGAGHLAAQIAAPRSRDA